jgi:hypothetical protein
MPRINRYTTQFSDPNGLDYVATFSHEHNEEVGIPVPAKDTTRPAALAQHVTVCKLTSGVTAKVIGQGLAFCHRSDVYDWQRGLELSLKAALKDADIKGQRFGDLFLSFMKELKQSCSKPRIEKSQRTIPIELPAPVVEAVVIH